MALHCSCSHNRLDHVGGDLINDSRVLKCNVLNCTCSTYHSSKDNDTSYLYKSFAITLAFFAIGVGAFFGISGMVDLVLEPYSITIIEENPTFLVYENGTRVDDIIVDDPKDNLSEVIKMSVFIAFYIMYAIFIFMFIMPVYEANKRKAINSK